MPTRRTPKNRNTRIQITPAAVELFRLLREIEDAGENDGSRREEYIDASVELHRLLGRLPADVNIMAAANPEAPDYCDPLHDYATAHALRVALEEQL
jgi:hypothetical protein